MVTNPKSKKTSENGKSIKYMKLKKMQGGAQKAPMKYAPEVAPTATSNSLKWWIAGAYLLSLVAIAGLAAALTVGVLGYEKAKGNTFENNTQVVIYNITNNITEIIYVNSTSNASGTGIVETIVPGPGINVTDTDPANPIVWNTGLYDANAGENVIIDKTDPHNITISATGGSNATGIVESIVPGPGINVTNTDPANPIVWNTGLYDANAGSGILIDKTDPHNITISATGGVSSLSATLNGTGSIGDIFILSEQDNGLALYPSANYVFEFVTTPTSIGSTNAIYGYGIIADSTGNMYVTGVCYASTATFGSTTLTCGASGNVFVAKMSSTGTYLWAVQSTSVTGSAGMFGYGNSIGIDSSDNIYITGYINTDATFGATTLTSVALNYAFIASIDSSGTWLWAIQATGTIASRSNDIDVTSTGTACIAIQTFGNDATFGSITPTTTNGGAGFACADNTGTWTSALVSDTTAGESYANGVVIDSLGDVIISGSFSIDVTFGATTLTSLGSSINMFVAKSDPSGPTWTWSVQGTTPSTTNSYGYDLDVDSSDNIYVSGNCDGDCTFDTVDITSTFTTVYVIKLDPTGVTWFFVAYSTGTAGGGTIITALSVFDTNIYISGQFDGNMILGQTSMTQYSKLLTDTSAFVAALSTTTGDWFWSVQSVSLIVNLQTYSYAISTDSSGNIYTTGTFQQKATFGDTTVTHVNTNDDAFFARIPSYGKTLNMITMLTEAGTSGNTVTYSLGGEVTGITGLTSGKSYYYDTTTEQIVTFYTPYYVGYATSTSALVFNPQPNYIVVV